MSGLSGTADCTQKCSLDSKYTVTFIKSLNKCGLN